MAPPLSAWTTTLRTWQERACADLLTGAQPDFLAMATPGAGKTRFALRVAHDHLTRRFATRVVVVCPTNHLRRQWARAAHQIGLQLDPSVTNEQSRETRDYHGCVVSYQQICLNPKVYRAACQATPTLTIFDELHHAGDGKDWGEALQEAFASSVRRLALSGTPFRTDNNPIPFVRYVDDQSVPDFSYGYREALADRVCRPIVFPTYEGELSWVSRGQEVTARFSDPLARRRQQERLKTALLNDAWLNRVMTDANDELTRIRQKEHPDAGGLIIAIDQDHARHVAAQVKLLTGKPARVAVSDDPLSSKTIDHFAVSRDRWLVAVNMVSEGVDIPRLRVGIYASAVQTEMYFRQVIGRFVRMQAGLPPSQRAYLYMPSDPRLIEYAEAIKAERDHVLLERAQAAPRTLFDTPGATASDPFIPLSAVAVPSGRIGDEAEPEPLTGSPATAGPRYEHREQLREVHKNLVSKIARRDGVEHRRINHELVRRTGCRIDAATVDQLKRRIKVLERWLERGYDERR